MIERATVSFDNYMKIESKYEELRLKVDNLESEKESLKADVDYWRDKYEQEVQYRQDNFKMIPEMEMYGLSESDFS